MILRRLLITNIWMILFYILMIAIPLNAERPTIIDTIWTENNLQGVISFYPVAGSYLYGICDPQQQYILVGDWYDQWYLNEPVSSRAYLSFSIQPIPINYQIDSVFILVYQDQCYNNDSPGFFPSWDSPYTYPCNLYHVNYGMTLEPADFEPEIYSLAGAISTDNVNGWKRLNITSSYLQDLNQNRPYHQVMLKFDILTDYDYSIDGVRYATTFSYFPEHLIIYYSPTNATSDEIAPFLRCLSIYPNPCKDIIMLEARNNAKISQIELYNIKGQKILKQRNPSDKTKKAQLSIDKSVVIPGIYILKTRLEFNNKQYTVSKKISVL